MIERIYDAIVDEDVYQQLPGDIASMVDAVSTWLMVAESDRPVVETAYNLDPSIFVDYEAYYHECDLWWATRHRMGMDTAVAFERMVPTRTFSSSEFYNDFARPHGDRMHGLGAITDVGGRMLALGLHRSRQGIAFDTQDEAKLQALLPHLNRMMRSRSGLAKANARLRLSELAFQSIDDALFLCDARGRVLHHNRAASRLPRSLLTVGSDGWIYMAVKRHGTALARALRGATERRVSGLLLVERPDRLPWRITVDATDRDEPVAIVAVRDLDRSLAARLDRASGLFQFTPSEQALAESLLRGRSIEEHAELRGTRISTARAQLRALLAKSHTPRQSALVAALLKC